MPEEFDRFADELDRMVAGQPPAGDSPLATFAREVQGIGTARVDDEQRDRIRRRLMQHATSASTPTTGGAGPLSQPTMTDPAMTNPWVRRRPAAATPTGWRGHMVKAQTAIAIMTAVALLIIGAAWYTNQQGSDDPGSTTTRYAAAPTEQAGDPQNLAMQESNGSATPDEQATPDGVTNQEAYWTEPISPEECTPREFRTDAEREELATGSPEFPDRFYGPVTTPPMRDATDAAMTLRRFEACRMSGADADGYVSDRFVYERTNQAQQRSSAEDSAARAQALQEISAAYQDVEPTDFIVVPDGPPGTPPVSTMVQETPGVFQPVHARQLADGRIALPPSQIAPEGMPSDSLPAYIGTVYIVSESDGLWHVDEMLPFCVGECNEFWQEMGPMPGPDATPAETPQATAETSSPLMEMLAILPAEMTGIGFGTLDGWLYADIEQRFADLGLTDEMLAEDPMLPLANNAYAPLASTTNLFDVATDQDFVNAIGFNPVTVDQVLVAGAIPDTITLLRGDWDENALIAAWEAAGYTPHETDNGDTIWSLSPIAEFTTTHPIQGRMYAQMNNVTILDDGTLAYAGTLDAIEKVLRAEAREIPAASQDAIADLVTALPGDMVSTIGYDMPGSVLYNRDEIQQNPNIAPEDKDKIEEPFAASLEAVGPMPDYYGAVFAFAGGEDEESEAVVILGAQSEEDADQIVRVIEWRWQNFLSQRYQRPLESVMPLVESRAEGTTVVLGFDMQGTPEMWLNLLNGGDLAAFAVDDAQDAAEATPQATVDEWSPLTQMLAVLPAALSPAEGGATTTWIYADIEQRFADLGLTDESLAEDPMLPLATDAYAPLARTTELFDYAVDEEFVDAIGFSPLTVDQVLVSWRTPELLTLVRGEWDEGTLIAAWEAAGYTPQTTENGDTIWSLDPDGILDPDHPIQSRMFQQLNNVAILDGGILVYADTSQTVELVLETQAGSTASVLDDPTMSTLAASMPDGTISSIGNSQTGSMIYSLERELEANLSIQPEEVEKLQALYRESRTAVGPMPEYRGIAFSLVGGADGEGEAVVHLGAFSEEDAEQIVRVVEWRWQNFTSTQYQRTFDSILPLVDASADGTTVTLRFDAEAAPHMWMQVLQGEGIRAFAVDDVTHDGDGATPTASPEAMTPVDDRIWLACPDYDGPYTYAMRDGVTSDVPLSGAFHPRSSWGPAEPPSIPCDYPGTEPPERGNPIPLD